MMMLLSIYVSTLHLVSLMCDVIDGGSYEYLCLCCHVMGLYMLLMVHGYAYISLCFMLLMN